METLLDIVLSAGAWRPGFSLIIENPPYTPLVIEALGRYGPWGLPALSVAHFGELNGDLMRDPEMCFELSFADGPDLNPFFYRNDYIGCEQWSRAILGTDYAYKCEVHRQHVSFAKVWDRKLRSQGFGKAFHEQRKQVA